MKKGSVPASGLALLLAASAPAQVPSRIGARLAAGERLHVVVYGTSLTSGGAWPRQMRDAIDRLYPGQIVLDDTAKSGEHSDWGVANFKARVLDHRPDVLFLEFAVNDAVRRFHIPLARSRRNLDQMIDRARAQNPNVEIVLQTTNPVVDRPKTDPGYRPYLYNYFNVVREAAAAKRTVLIDQETGWQKVLNEGRDAYRAVVPDGLHPSPQGYAEVATPRILRTMALRHPPFPWVAVVTAGGVALAGLFVRRRTPPLSPAREAGGREEAPRSPTCPLARAYRSGAAFAENALSSTQAPEVALRELGRPQIEEAQTRAPGE